MAKNEKLTDLEEFQSQPLTDEEKKLMAEHMEKNADKKLLLPEENEDGVIIYNKENVPWDVEKIFMPSMMSVVKEHLIYLEDEETGNRIPYLEFNYEKNMMFESTTDKVNILINVQKEELSAHFCVMLFDVENDEKYKQPFSFVIKFEDINDFGLAYFNRIKDESTMKIEMEENTIKITQTIKKD